LDAETGDVRGAAVKANWTLTVGAPKHGLIQSRAAEFVGRLEVTEDVGLIAWDGKGDLHWASAACFKGFPPPRPINGHKGTFGHLVVIGGSVGYHGAAVLAARGAQRAMPGLVTLCVLPEVYLPAASQLQSVMVHPWAAGWDLPASASAIVVGPGLAAGQVPEEFKNWVRDLWRNSPLPMIVDASALGWLPEGPVGIDLIRAVTPHPGEAGRMCGCTTGEILKDRLKKLREISTRWGRTWVVLKGLHTLTGRVADDIMVNSSGNPGLGQGGSGDILAGYLGGLLAQPRLRQDVAKTLAYGVWQHGAAADALAQERKVWSVEELLPWLGTI
jgi:NAD(P)H-hydrate epimerase